MSDDIKEGVKLSLTVTLNKEGNKVRYALADSYFVDILLSFLTLPLGRLVKILEKHYGDEALAIGSLNTLYHGLANLDSSHFWTEGAKNTLLNPTSPFEDEYEKLKIDISDPPPAEYFFCSKCTYNRFRSVSLCYDKIDSCHSCQGTMSKEGVTKSSEAPASSTVEVFTKRTSSFIICDDLHILPSEAGLLQFIGILGITDTDDNGKLIKVDLGFGEIMKLLKASLTSPTPLSDVILNKTTHISSPILNCQCQPRESHAIISGRFILKAMIQKSTGKLLYAQVKKDFVEFLLSLLYIPLGRVEYLMAAGKTCFKAIDNLHRSASELIDNECFNDPSMKFRLTKPSVVHGCISEDHHILDLTEEPLPGDYYETYNNKYLNASSVRFPKGKGAYLQGSQTYKLTDDLTVVPYCFVSILSSLREQGVLLSDIKEVEVKIGSKEGLSILKASLTSTTSALSHALFNHISTKKQKTEV